MVFNEEIGIITGQDHMKKIIKHFFLVLLLITVVGVQPISAAIGAACGEVGDPPCGEGEVCLGIGQKTCQLEASYDASVTDGDDIFGTIEAPQGVAQLNEQEESGIGIIVFVSNVIKLLAVVAGLMAMFNFIIAGFTYITAGEDPGKIEKIGAKLTMSVVGLAIIVASYTIAALIGLLLFNDPTYIINPQIPTAI